MLNIMLTGGVCFTFICRFWSDGMCSAMSALVEKLIYSGQRVLLLSSSH